MSVPPTKEFPVTPPLSEAQQLIRRTVDGTRPVAPGMDRINFFWFTKPQLLKIREILTFNPSLLHSHEIKDTLLLILLKINVQENLKAPLSGKLIYEDGSFEIPTLLFQTIRQQLGLETMTEDSLGSIENNARTILKAVNREKQ